MRAMSNSTYHEIVDRVLTPTLVALGFEEVKLSNCMRHEVLFRRDDLWFATSWDWREQYLELALGHLYWFRDVMPRVVVVGDYFNYSPTLKSLDASAPGGLESIVNAVALTLSEAIATRAHNPDIERARRAELRQYLIGKVTDDQLQAFGA